jgi:hypothetical protein
MPISDDLFLAILSMDAYNRGYGSGMGNANTGLAGSQLGNATIGRATNATTEPNAVAASFFAQAYDWNGTTVISYRGTDNFSIDKPTGYGIGFGFPAGVAGAVGWFNNSYQGELALQFYNQIAGQLATNDITLTGHSLGGGLAGFVANDNCQRERVAA